MAKDLELRLNPALNPNDYAEAYARDGIVQIENVFEPELASYLHEVLARHTPWRLVYPEPDGSVTYLTPQDMQAMGREAFGRRMRGVLDRAAKNYGYLYSAYPMIEAYMKGWDPGHPLHAVTEFLQSPEFREFGGRVIGHKAITKVDAQATLYSAGHFLTRHVDDGHEKERRAAYTLGFSNGWEPDWGGLLAFLTPELNIASAWTPRFNVWTLFDGLQVHSVTSVASYAPTGRYSITGWLRDDPPYKSHAGA